MLDNFWLKTGLVLWLGCTACRPSDHGTTHQKQPPVTTQAANHRSQVATRHDRSLAPSEETAKAGPSSNRKESSDASSQMDTPAQSDVDSTMTGEDILIQDLTLHPDDDHQLMITVRIGSNPCVGSKYNANAQLIESMIIASRSLKPEKRNLRCPAYYEPELATVILTVPQDKPLSDVNVTHYQDFDNTVSLTVVLDQA
jgi:hypothetical protein